MTMMTSLLEMMLSVNDRHQIGNRIRGRLNIYLSVAQNGSMEDGEDGDDVSVDKFGHGFRFWCTDKNDHGIAIIVIIHRYTIDLAQVSILVIRLPTRTKSRPISLNFPILMKIREGDLLASKQASEL